jgi:hypothetical protein
MKQNEHYMTYLEVSVPLGLPFSPLLGIFIFVLKQMVVSRSQMAMQTTLVKDVWRRGHQCKTLARVMGI